MKICQIIPWFPSANPTTLESKQGIFWYRQAVKLGEKGNELKIISIRWNGQLDHERVNNNIEVFRVACIFSLVKYPLPDFMDLTKKIKNVCASWDPDIIVYNHMEYLTALPVIYLNNTLKKPIVVTIDSLPGYTWFCGNRLIDTIGYINSTLIGKKIFHYADAIQFLSSNLYDIIPKLNIDRDKVFLLTTGVDIDIFKKSLPDDKLKKALGLDEDNIVFLFVGRLDLVKGVNHLLNVAKKIISRNNKVKFLIVGDGSLRKEYELNCKDYRKNIIFTGYRDNIPDYMNISDVFVLPSLSEGAPNVVMEASAMCLPVIATKVGEIPKLVSDHETGILVSPGDETGLLNAIELFINDPSIIEEMGERGRKKIADEYSWDIICNKIDHEYHRVISRYHSKYGWSY